MPKKGGKKKTKGGAKPAAVAAVDKVADATKTVGYVDTYKSFDVVACHLTRYSGLTLSLQKTRPRDRSRVD